MGSNNLIKKEFHAILKCVIDAIRPSKLINNHLKLENKVLTVTTSLKFNNAPVQLKKDSFQLYNHNVYVLAFGKASLGKLSENFSLRQLKLNFRCLIKGMSQSVESLLGSENLSGGIAIVPYNEALNYLDDPSQLEIYPSKNSKIKYFYGAKVTLFSP